MATYTTHYNLKKPQATDTTEIITDLNANYDTIDTALYGKASTTHGSTHITGGSDVIPDAVAGGNSGLMSGADKQKLDDVISKAHIQGTDTTLGTMSGDIDMNFHKITNVTDPTSAQDAATKNYVDTHGIALDQVVLGSQIFG